MRTQRATEYVHLEDCRIMQLSEKAACVRYDGKEHWIAFSCMADGEEKKLEVGDYNITVSVSEWIANKLGIKS